MHSIFANYILRPDFVSIVLNHVMALYDYILLTFS